MKREFQLLELESKKCFEFFWNEANADTDSAGYGLIRDRYPSSPNICSIASVGFALTSYPIGVERGWIRKKEAEERALGTLNTFLYNTKNFNGFYYHFLNMKTAQKAFNCEVSLIDTGILICGAITAGEYFGGEVKKKAEELYKRVNWNWFRDPKNNQFYMGYKPTKGFQGYWDYYAEQLILYILSSASPTHPTDPNMFYSFIRRSKKYGNSAEFIHSWFGSIFTYQYSHGWIDFRNKRDKEGIDWWTNSKNACKASRQYCIDNSKKYKTFDENSWGITATDGPSGYNGLYGTPPSGNKNKEHFVDGTVSVSGAAGSIPFIPDEAIKALCNYYKNFPPLWGKYGFKDSFNFEKKEKWFASDIIGINKGITLLMIENYRTGLIWNLFMQNKYVKEGLLKIRFTNEEEESKL